jgi:hypothetical protein
LFNSLSLVKFLTVLLIFGIPVVSAAINVNETFFLKKDGSGALTLSYNASDVEIKAKNSIIGNFPFTKEKVEELFKSKLAGIYSVNVEKDPKDNNRTKVTITLTFGNITNLNDVKPLAGANRSWQETDTGLVIMSVYTPAFVENNSIDNLYQALKYESTLKSSNGNAGNDNGVTFFRGKEYIDGKSDIRFFATYQSEGKKEKVDDPKSDAKSCGLFGFELPFVLLLGFIYTLSSRKGSRGN